MQDEIVIINNREIRICLMDNTRIISECAHHRSEGYTSEGFKRFHKEIMKRYGNAGVVALSDDTIVGFANFYPAVLNSRFTYSMCPEIGEDDLKIAFEQMEWPKEKRDTLSISCINLDSDLCRKGIGTKLVQKVIEWARENRYKRIHAGANDTQWWIPCKEFYERLGFYVIGTEEFEEPREDGEMRVYTMEFSLIEEQNTNA